MLNGNARFSPATPEKIAEIKRLEKLARKLGSEANRPFVIVPAIATSMLLFYLIVSRKGAPFNDIYESFRISPIYNDFLDYDLVGPEIEVAKVKDFFDKSKQSVQDTCLIFHDVSLKYAKITELGVDNTLKKILSTEEIHLLRQRCIHYCEECMRFLRLPSDYLLSEHTASDISEVTLEQLFLVTRKLLNDAENMLVDLKKWNEDGMDAVRFIRKLKKANLFNPTINGIKLGIIYGTIFIQYHFLKWFRPYSLGHFHTPLTFPQTHSLTLQAADNEIKKLSELNKLLTPVASRNSNYMNGIYCVITVFALFLGLALGFSNLPGEIAFFFLSSLGSLLYQTLCLGWDVYKDCNFSQYLKSAQKALDSNFGNCFFVEHNKETTLDRLQFNLVLKRSNLNPEDVVIILKRLLNKFKIPIIASNSSVIVVPYIKNINASGLEKIKKEFNACVDRLNGIDGLDKKLNRVQVVLNGNYIKKSKLSESKADSAPGEVNFYQCHKTFDKDGMPTAIWYLFTRNQKYAERLHAELGEQCSIKNTVEGWSVTVNYHKSLNDINVTPEKWFPQQATPKTVETESMVSQSSKPSKRSSTTLTLKALTTEYKETSDDIAADQKEPAIKQLPAPYQNARRIQAHFLPHNGHTWAIFTAKENTFPRETTLYTEFKALFTDPTVVPPVGKQGLVYDKDRSKKNDARYKAKLLGEFGQFRVIEKEKVTEVTTEQGTTERLHVFDTLVLEHT